MTPDESYAAALQRIEEANRTSATVLHLRNLPLTQIPEELGQLRNLKIVRLDGCAAMTDLSVLSGLTSLWSLDLSNCIGVHDLSVLGHLTALEVLDLSWCASLRDLSALCKLTALRSLNLYACIGVTDLSALSGLTALQELDLSRCVNVRCFRPLCPLLGNLTTLHLYRCAFDDLPVALCGSTSGENVLGKVRAHFADLEGGATEDAERKLFILGNGGVGKTQTRRRLCGHDFEPKTPSTHGVEIEEFPLRIEGRTDPVTLQIWDFGGQDIYHGTHALFLQANAVFLLLWTPESETSESVENGIPLRNRPLAYWLDYLRGLVGTHSPVLVARNKCDRSQGPEYPLDLPRDFAFRRSTDFSALKGRLGGLKDFLAEAVEYLLDKHPIQKIGVGRSAVRQRLRAMQTADRARPNGKKRHRTLPRQEYLALCQEEGNVSDPDALLDFLHLTGVVYHRPGQFEGRIILDQNWALDAIYAVLHREKTLPHLILDGRFTRQHLAGMAWQEHSEADQRLLLDMMVSCGICFRLKLAGGWRNPEWLYVAPDLLPEWDEARRRLLLGRLQQAPPDASVRVHYPFLHEGVLRSFLSEVGRELEDAGVYWKYGCWFGEEKTRSTILVRSAHIPAKGAPWAGEVTLEAWGKKADKLVHRVQALLLSIPLGHPPDVAGRVEESPDRLVGAAHALGLPGKSKQVFVSYAWGEDKTVKGRRHEQKVEEWCRRVESWGYDIIRDKERMRPGDLISEFMKLAGRTPRVLVILNARYLRSEFCMAELHEVYQRCRDSTEFQQRIVPMCLPGADYHSREQRTEHGVHWLTQFEKQATAVRPGITPTSDYAAIHRMFSWAQAVPEMLALLADVLHSVGFDDDPEKIRARLA
jgi:internalin A